MLYSDYSRFECTMMYVTPNVVWNYVIKPLLTYILTYKLTLSINSNYKHLATLKKFSELIKLTAVT